MNNEIPWLDFFHSDRFEILSIQRFATLLPGRRISVAIVDMQGRNLL